MPIVPTPTGSPIEPTAVVLPQTSPRHFACTYTQRANSGNTVIVYDPCGYTPIASEEAHPSAGKYIKRLMAVDIPLVLLGGYVPKPGDSFIGPDGIHTFNVIKCQSSSIYFCRIVGVCPQISTPLQDLVQFVQADCTGSSSNMERIVSFSAIGSTIAASIQPLDQDLADLFHIKATPETYAIYLNHDLGAASEPGVMKAGAYLQDPSDNIYEIVEVKNRDRLDELVCCICKRKLN